ncbi:MAG: LPP20 family lipoprotein [Plesiomonas sp.]|uniref:LPP20 family lipoprotein n=1 Tax=Plesiomonas sp. TaxID=2486279 RepID=UPI003EE753CE
MRKLKISLALVVCTALLGCAPNSSSQILNAVGYAPIAVQPGKTAQERQLQAMRASRLDAYREMTEQLYGLKISSHTQVLSSGSLRDAGIQTQAAGWVRGAQVVRSYPVGDNYVTELRLDLNNVKKLPAVASAPKAVVEKKEQVILVPARSATF